MNTHRAPKQWCLSKTETVNSFENWRQNILYTLSLDANFAPFLSDGVRWEKKSRAAPHRGFTNDAHPIPENQRRTREQKVAHLELMLGQIANYCPVISRNTLIKNSTSMDFIWQQIRLHFGFQSTGAHLIDFCDIKLEPNERPEDLYQRLMAFSEDNLLRRDLGILHHGEQLQEDEEMTPSLENFIVLTWLRLIHPDLPKLVKQRYGTELRTRTLASIKPEISQALDSLREELQSTEEARAMRAYVLKPKRDQHPPSKAKRVCPLCKEAGRPDNHFLSKCSYLPFDDRRFIAKARQVADCEETEDPGNTPCNSTPLISDSSKVNRVAIRQSPYLDVFYGHHTARLTIDSGATGNMMRLSCAQRLGAKIACSSHSVSQADGSSQLKVVGETRLSFSHEGHDLYYEGIVVENLDSDVLAGIPFMEKNDVSVRPAKQQILIGDSLVCSYGSTGTPADGFAVRRAHVLRSSAKSVIWPGEFVELDLPDDLVNYEGEVSVEPHVASESWPFPSLVSSVAGKIRVPNLTSEPQSIGRNEHVCKVRSTFIPAKPDSQPAKIPKLVKSHAKTRHSEHVKLDPDGIMTADMKGKFRDVLTAFDEVFNPSFHGYNGAVGPLQGQVNMGPVQPPQRKGRVPQYSKNQLDELQSKFDELEEIGVFRRPEDVGVSVEYVNPSFLVKKPSGGFRLVTAFADVGRYSKPQPSLMPDVDSTLRHIAQWSYIIATDLTKAFYQIPLAKESMKYCGVVTPFKGVRVYARTAMGMPGSETALEELTCRVLGHLVQKGVVAKVADDLYCGGNSVDELLSNWKAVLQALHNSGLRLSATKTVIAPQQTVILGWVWRLGTLQASPHRIATLSTCPIPSTVNGLRSFIGAFKVLARVIQNCSTILSPLDDMVAGRESKETLHWSDEQLTSFEKAQKSLNNARSITLPRATDQLWIVTDGAVRSPGIGATLYVTRDNKARLAGYFSAKLHKNQINWLPCEIEALSIATALKHFSPYLIQSSLQPCVLTDSKPCVQAFEKLCRGEFSASPRVTSFLSTASRFQVSVRHVAGCAILPSDFASRNAPPCAEPTCQICTFVSQEMDSVVRSISTSDILEGNARLPFTSRSAWLGLQSDCSDLRRTCAHLRQGTRPSKKITNARDVKRYLNVSSLSADGLVVVKRTIPLSHSSELIVVPRQVLDGLLTSLHVKLDHPTCHQLKTIVHRYFYALDMDAAIQRVSDNCHRCASLKHAPTFVQTQTSSVPPVTVGSQFAADVIKRERQLILVVRECVTSYTEAMLLEDERRDTLRDGLIRSCINLRPMDGPYAVVRTDCAPGFRALFNDEFLSRHRISVELGNAKNCNKNPVAERAVQELEEEILRQDSSSRSVSPLSLSLAINRLNSRIRKSGLSSREMLTQRDQFHNSQIPINDESLIAQQHQRRQLNHSYSEKSKAPSGRHPVSPDIHVGDLVYLYSDRNKSSGRDRYLVTHVDTMWCNIKKFVGNQLRAASYRVKRSDLYRVSTTADERIRSPMDSLALVDIDDNSDTDASPANSPPQPPDIPNVISVPPARDTTPILPPAVDDVPTSDSNQLASDTFESDSLTNDSFDFGNDDDDLTPSMEPPRRSSRPSVTPRYLSDYVRY